MDAMLGCGGKASDSQLAAVRKTLMPMWETLPKTTPTSGRVDRRSLRYLVHRYFMQTSSLMIRGFEPTRPVNESHWGVADVMSQMVPAFVESILESKHAKTQGFSMDDAIRMVVMLEKLVHDSDSTLLKKVYEDQHKKLDGKLNEASMKEVLEAYMIRWMIDGEEEDFEILLTNRTLLKEIVPHFESLVDFVAGRMKVQKYNTLSRSFSFDDA